MKKVPPPLPALFSFVLSRYIYCLCNLYRGNRVDIMKDENSSDKDEVECDELKDAYDALYEESFKI